MSEVTQPKLRAFSEVSAVVATADTSVFDVVIDPGWSIGGRPNGGYLLAMLGRAAAAVVDHDDVIAASAHYLRSPDPGPATVKVVVLRAGRSASQVRSSLMRDGDTLVEAVFTVGTVDPGAVPYWDGGVPSSPDVPFDESFRIGSPTPTGVEVALLGQVDLRLDPAVLGFGVGEPSGKGELWGWLALPDGESFDPCSLLFAVDAFPPATFDIEQSGWVPTLELTVYVRAVPAPGPVRILQKARLIDGQRVDEACFVWDSTGRLVAHGTQLAGIRLG